MKEQTKAIWTPEMIATLRAEYPNTRTQDLAERLGVTPYQAYGKAWKLGLKKSDEFLASPVARRLNGVVGGSTRFIKGQRPWNYGMKGLSLGRKEHWFEKGVRQGKATELYQPIGAERLSKEGYLQRKINDDQPPQRRWRGVHLIIWEAKYGPIPPGHALAFRDGDKTNITLDNLELVTRADLMRRNSCHRYGEEIAKLVQLRGALTRQINRRTDNV